MFCTATDPEGVLMSDLREALDAAHGTTSEPEDFPGPADVAGAVSDLIERSIAPLRQRVMDLELTVSNLRSEVERLSRRSPS